MQAAGQIADIGGGALMAAFGILAALRERERSGKGQLVDVSMFDGALSWLALVAARYLCERVVPERGTLELAGALICYRPYACKDGWVTLGALEPKFWQAWCARRGARGPDGEAVRGARARTRTPRWSGSSSSARARSGASSPPTTTAASSRCSDLDEALDSELVRAREMVVELDQPGADGVRLLGVPVKLSRTPGAPAGPGPALGEHTREVLSALGYDEGEIAALEEAGAVAGPAETGARGSFMG